MPTEPKVLYEWVEANMPRRIVERDGEFVFQWQMLSGDWLSNHYGFGASEMARLAAEVERLKKTIAVIRTNVDNRITVHAKTIKLIKTRSPFVFGEVKYEAAQRDAFEHMAKFLNEIT
jgi:hypothetical protein